jgi:hypothetical protein
VTIRSRKLVTMLVMFFGAGAAIGAQVLGSPVRRVRERPGTPIASIVRAGEEGLVIESVQDPPDEVQLGAGVPRTEFMTKRSRAILVVDVVSIDGQVTARQDWISSHVTASLVDIMKAPNEWSRKIGDLVTFEQEGGEAVVAGTKVQALLMWARPVEVGKRYLIFGTPLARTNGVQTGPSGIYEMTDSGGFRRLARPRGPDDIETSEQAVVLIRIRDALN